MKKTKIMIQEIDNQRYNRLVEHFMKYSSIKTDDGDKNLSLLYIKEIGAVNGNPPTYHRVEIEVSTDVTAEKEKIKVSEAMKGLVDILLTPKK